MTDVVAGFNWDDGNREKCRKHGLTLDDIESVFRQGKIRTLPDPVHSAQETRYLGVGRIASGRHLFVAYTYREIEKQRLIRPISARFMHTREIEHYEAQSQRLEEAASTQD